MWDAIGLAERPTFHDGRRLIIYGQRTTDGRIAFGGRGAPYHFGSKVRPEFDTDGRVRELLTDTLRELFPVLQDTAITHHWGGVLAAPRDWTPFVRYDKAAGLGNRRRLRRRRGRHHAPRRAHVGGVDHRQHGGRGRRARRGCPGSATSHAAGSPSRCGGWVSTAPAWQPPDPTRPSHAPAAPAGYGAA